VTYGSKDAPQLQPTGRFNNDTSAPKPSTPEQRRQKEIEAENAEKGYNFQRPTEPSKRKVKRRKRFSLPKTNQLINLKTINYIDGEGQFHRNMPLAQALQSFSRDTHTLVLVDELTSTCRLFTNKDYNNHLENLRRQHKAENISAKELQITWNVGDSDLQYRLTGAIKHLKNGGRVNIILGARKVKLVRTRQQREELLGKIRDTLAPYGTEWREMTGGFPNAELWFQGNAPKNDAEEEAGMEDEDMDEDMDEEDEEEVEEGEDATEAVTDETKVDSDDTSLSWEDFQANRAKFKGKENRRALRTEADKAFAKTTGTNTTSISDDYWKEFATSAVTSSSPQAQPQKTSHGQPGTSNPAGPKKTKGARSKSTKEDAKPRNEAKVDEAAVKAAEKARLAELSGKVVPQEGEDVVRTELKSVAEQFSKLGSSKSLFGRKLGSR